MKEGSASGAVKGKRLINLNRVAPLKAGVSDFLRLL